MKAFLKRRWFLLSLAVVLFACSAVDFRFLFGGRNQRQYHWAIAQGCIEWRREEDFVYYHEPSNELSFELHAPMLQMSANFIRGLNQPHLGMLQLPLVTIFYNGTEENFVVCSPIWLPLTAVLGWLVFRELRWREKRAKLAEAPPSP